MSPRFFIPLVFLFLSSVSFGQVIINEISYNPPEAGNDSLEYIELLNIGLLPVNIDGWYFETGVEDTLPNVEIQPGGYFVTCINASAMLNVFGITAHEWEGNALSNNGESIRLVDGSGTLIDSVLYDDTDPWPGEPDGNGPSLELKSPELDNNDGANWHYSGGTTGVIIEGFEVAGTPGAENSGGGTPGPDLTISLANLAFVPNVAVIEVGSLVRWVSNEPHLHNVNGRQTDYPDNPESFYSGDPAGGPWEYEFEFTIAGTYEYQCDIHVGLGMTGTIYVYDPDEYNNFPLEALRLTDANGSALFDGVPTTIEGTVHGVNFQPPGLSVFVIDETNVGINVFSFDPPVIPIQEGDHLRVFGTIDQFNGLLEIIPDNIISVDVGLDLNDPRFVTEVTEEDESSYIYSQLLEVDSVSNISASGYTIYTNYEQQSNIQIRVDSDANIFLEAEDIFPGAWLEVFGIGTQFDNSFPFTSGYQILAVELHEIIDGVTRLDDDAITAFPNPATEQVFFKSETLVTDIQVYSLEGKPLRFKSCGATEFAMSVEGLSKGMYIVEARTDEGTWTSKIMVMR